VDNRNDESTPSYRWPATTFSPDNKLQQQRLSQLDKLYQRVVQALDDLVRAVGLKTA